MMENELNSKTDKELASFFDAAKDTVVTPSTALLSRIEKDALAQMEKGLKTVEAPKTSRLGAVLQSIGGWQSVTALTACACIGIFAGYLTPDSLDYFNDTQSIAVTPDDGSFSVASDIEILFQEG